MAGGSRVLFLPYSPSFRSLNRGGGFCLIQRDVTRRRGIAQAAGGGAAETEAPRTLLGRLGVVGPGIVVAVTGVGAGDMITSLVVGTEFGTALLWAIVIGALLKYFLTEGIGRWYMAFGQTILRGWHSIGWWARGYFLVYLLIATFDFGAAITSTCALAVGARFPGVMPLWAWAVLQAGAAFLIVGIGRYEVFERIMKAFAAFKFGIVIPWASCWLPPRTTSPSGSRRVCRRARHRPGRRRRGGGTFTLASYGYWAREHGRRQPAWIPTMRTDIVTGYVLTGCSWSPCWSSARSCCSGRALA